MPSTVAERTEHVDPSTSGPARDRPLIAPPRWLARLFVVAGSVGLVAACVLLIEKVRLLEDPTYVPSCSINPILSCGSVMVSDQAEAFGVPNPLLGLVGFTLVLVVGVATLAGASMRRWFWVGLEGGVLFGVGFVHWLIFQSLYRIGALCPYCMVVWAVVIPLAWYTTLWILRDVWEARPGWLRSVVDGAWLAHIPILTAWFLAIAGAITVRFWDYWSTLL